MATRTQVRPRVQNYLSMQSRSPEDRPREKLLRNGSGSLSNAELLGILIGSGIPSVSSVDLARLILKEYKNDLTELAKCSVRALQRFSGIGKAKATSIVSALELGRRKDAQKLSDKQPVNSSDKVYRLVKPVLADKITEEFWLILLQNNNHVLHMCQVGKGGVGSVGVDPKVIFRTALEYSAPCMILVHNHPDEEGLFPSMLDVNFTKSIVQSARLLDIKVLDHLIFTNKSYFSFIDEQVLPFN